MLKLIKGLLTADQLREAAASDFHDVIQLVRQALSSHYKSLRDNHIDSAWFSAHMMTNSDVVVESQGRYFCHSYTISDDNVVTLGDAKEVTRTFTPVTDKNKAVPTATPVREATAAGVFLEAKDATGTQWVIRVINAGKSLNNVNYPESTLRESVGLFNGARVFEKSDEQHIKGQGKDFSKLIGRLSNAQFIEAANGLPAGINAQFDVLESAGDAPAKLLEAFQRGMADIFGFSIDAEGSVKRVGKMREAKKITKVNSVDLIIEPGAGGQLVSLIEAKQSINNDPDEDSMKQRMIEAVKKANGGQLPQGLDVENESALLEAYNKTLTTAADKTAADAQETARLAEAKAAVTAAHAEIDGSDLPAAAKERVKARFTESAAFDAAAPATAISQERTYIAGLKESGKVNMNGLGDTTLKEEYNNPKANMLDDFFAGKNGMNSFREAYVQITGDTHVSGQSRNCDQSKLREALGRDHEHLREAVDSTTFGVILGDAIHRRLLELYNTTDHMDVYRQLTGPAVPLNDFRENTRVTMGGYGDLPDVAESGNYNALTTPGENAAKYALKKTGGTESITMESIANDDVMALRRIPMKMSQAAKRTLSKFVLDHMVDNNPIYDAQAVNWFDAAHGNLGSAALSSAAYAAARIAMMQQAEPGSNDRMGIMPSTLWVPAELEETAYDMFRRDTNNDQSFVNTLNPAIVPVWYWADADDWCVTADPAMTPIFELGFWRGQENPEIFIQDAPTVGSMFNNDTITYKIRHIYGGAVTGHAGAYKSVV